LETTIITENLTKKYGNAEVVSDVSLHIRKGEIDGFLGLNGAGKTTTIRMILGLVNPSRGKVFIKGKKVGPGSESILKDIGSLVEMPYSYPNLTVRENLEMVRQLRGIKNKSAVTEVIKKLDLGINENKIAKKLSLGNAQRLGLANALIHKPEILILDEPTNGLDPAGIFEIREMLKNLAEKEGVTIFVSSHILSEVSRFASRIGIIHKGIIIQEINTEDLEKHFKKVLIVKTAKPAEACEFLKEKGYQSALIHDGAIEIKASNAIDNSHIIATELVYAGYPPSILMIEEEGLESYFFRKIS